MPYREASVGSARSKRKDARIRQKTNVGRTAVKGLVDAHRLTEAR